MLMLFNVRLFVTLSDSVKQSVNLATSIQTRNDILDRRLQQSHNVGDKFVLALDSYQLVKFFSTYEEALLSICTLQGGDTFLLVLLDQLGRYVCRLCEHDGRIAFQALIQRSVVNIRSLKCLVQKLVLHNQQFDLVLEALPTEVTGLSCIQSGNVNQIEMRIFLQFLSEFYDDSIF